MMGVAAVAAAVGVVALAGCENVPETYSKAQEAVADGDYEYALEKILKLKDKSIEDNPNVMLLLSEAYFGATGKSVMLDGRVVCDMDFPPDGKSVFFADLEPGTIMEYSYPDMELQMIFRTPSPCYGVAVSPDGKWLATAESNNDITLYDLASWKPEKVLKGHSNRVRTVDWIDSTHLVSGGNDQYMITWDVTKGKLLDKQWPHRKNIKSVRKSRDGKHLVSASNDGTAVVWDFSDVGSPRKVSKVKHSRNYVNDAALSPNNDYMVTVSGDGDAKLWDARSGSSIKTIRLEDVGCSVDYSPDGNYVAVGGKFYVYVLDTKTWKTVAKYPVCNEAVANITFLDNGRLAFMDSSHFYEAQLLTGSDLIKAAREWLAEQAED